MKNKKLIWWRNQETGQIELRAIAETARDFLNFPHPVEYEEVFVPDKEFTFTSTFREQVDYMMEQWWAVLEGRA